MVKQIDGITLGWNLRGGQPPQIGKWPQLGKDLAADSMPFTIDEQVAAAIQHLGSQRQCQAARARPENEVLF